MAAKKANIAFAQRSAYLTLLASMRICQLCKCFRVFAITPTVQHVI